MYHSGILFYDIFSIFSISMLDNIPIYKIRLICKRIEYLLNSNYKNIIESRARSPTIL